MSELSVKSWLKMSSEDFYKQKNNGTCIKCGKKAKNRHHVLCENHCNEFYRWQNKQTGEK